MIPYGRDMEPLWINLDWTKTRFKDVKKYKKHPKCVDCNEKFKDFYKKDAQQFSYIFFCKDDHNSKGAPKPTDHDQSSTSSIRTERSSKDNYSDISGDKSTNRD